MSRLNSNDAYGLLMMSIISVSTLSYGADTLNHTVVHNQPTAITVTSKTTTKPSAATLPAHHWNSLAPHKRQHLLAQYHHLQHLAPSEQKSLHKKAQWFQGLSPTEQTHLRQLWQHLNLDERQDWLRRMQATPAKQQPALRLELLKKLNQRES
jgi:hypothetical protein